MNTVCLLLAAGSSSRMKVEHAGTHAAAKMFLELKGKTFLQHIIDEVSHAALPLLVVTGCHHELLAEPLSKQEIPFIKNLLWEEGMGSSIHTGIADLLLHFPQADSVIIMVCDQPHISASLLVNLVDTYKKTGKGIIACSYAGTTGTPVLFDKKYFEELLLLSGPNGAKKIIRQFKEDVAEVEFPEGAIDIDTAEDYRQLKQQFNQANKFS